MNIFIMTIDTKKVNFKVTYIWSWSQPIKVTFPKNGKYNYFLIYIIYDQYFSNFMSIVWHFLSIVWHGLWDLLSSFSEASLPIGPLSNSRGTIGLKIQFPLGQVHSNKAHGLFYIYARGIPLAVLHFAMLKPTYIFKIFPLLQCSSVLHGGWGIKQYI